MVGLGAWLLGAVTATTGCMVAVSELAHGLLVSQTQQLGAGSPVAGVIAGSASPSPSPAGSTPPPRASHRPARIRHSASPNPLPATQNSVGTLLESGDGSVMATCEAGRAYLLYWSPDQGFQAEDVARGPSTTASVTFRGPSSAILMRVSCPAGVPVAHLSQLSWNDRDDSPSAGASPSGGTGE
jgi:hypothetical protein